MSTCIYLVRHGKTDKSKLVTVGDELEGHQEATLDDSFIPKIEEFSEKLKNENITKVYSSNFVRTKKTADILSNGLEVKVDDRLKERAGGIPNLDITPQEYYKMQVDNPDFKFPEGESVNEIMSRMYDAITDMIKENKGGNTLVVSHGAAITFLLMKWCRVDVIDVPKKIRRFEYNGKVIHEGICNFIQCFKLTFDDEDRLVNIEVFN